MALTIIHSLTHEVQPIFTSDSTTDPLYANDQIIPRIPQLADDLGVDRLWGDDAYRLEVPRSGVELQ